MNIRKLLSGITFLLSVFMHSLTASAQPGDHTFSVIAFDEHGMFECSPYYKFYACTVKYPNSRMHIDSLQLVWKPDLSTISVIETLKCIPVANDTSGIPFKYYFEGSSC